MSKHKWPGIDDCDLLFQIFRKWKELCLFASIFAINSFCVSARPNC